MRRTIYVFALLAIGCGGGASYGAPYMSLEAPPHRRGVEVEGRDCTAQSSFGHARSTSVVTAMRHALEGSGSTALVDVEVSNEVPNPFETCIVVRGVSVR